MTEPNRNDVQNVLSEEILADARTKAERILKRAQDEAQKTADRALKDAESARDALLRDAREKASLRREVFRSGLILDEHRRRVAAQGRLIDEVFAQTLARLNSRSGFDYRATLVKLAAEAVAQMPAAEFVLRLAKSDLDAFRHDLPGAVAAAVKQTTGREVKVSVAESPAAIEAGVVVDSVEGRERCDNSFAARVRRMQDDLRFHVADMLFGEFEEPQQPGSTAPRPESGENSGGNP